MTRRLEPLPHGLLAEPRSVDAARRIQDEITCVRR